MNTDWKLEVSKHLFRHHPFGKPDSLFEDRALELIERAYTEGREEGRRGAIEQVNRAVDQFLKSRWPDTGDRPSPPPPGVLALADTLMALK